MALNTALQSNEAGVYYRSDWLTKATFY